MKPENAAKAKLRKKVREYFGSDIWIYTTQDAKSGIPDWLVCYKGLFLAIEFKGDSDLMPLQERNLAMTTRAGGSSIMWNTDGQDILDGLIKYIRHQYHQHSYNIQKEFDKWPSDG